MKECGKSVLRWIHDSRFVRTYFAGDGIDIGAGNDPLANYRELFPRIDSLRSWDVADGDAELMSGVADASCDFVHSSHCLEHMKNPERALGNWLRLLKPGGHMVVVVPDEDLYEQGAFPSTFNSDHKWTFTIRKASSWSGKSINLVDFLARLPADAEIVKLDRLDGTFRYRLPRFDQTATPIGECAIEFIVRRRPHDEVVAGGRLPAKRALTATELAQLPTVPPRSVKDALRDIDRLKDRPFAHPAAKELPHALIAPVATYSPWLGDEHFRSAYAAARGHTLVDQYRAYELWRLVGELAPVPGDILEVGVWRGGTSLVLALAATKFGLGIEVVAADTFKGVAKAGRHDSTYRGGEHADASEELVKRLFDRSGCTNVRILSGVFPDETGDVIAQRSFRMCHVDVDVYESARDTLEWIWPRLARGGVVVFDDYGFVKCPGVTRFVNECRQRPDALLLYNLNGHALLVKR